MDAFRAELGGPSPPRPPGPTPTSKEDKLYVILVQQGDPQGRTFVSDLISKTYIPDLDALAALQFTLGSNGYDNSVHTVLPSQMAGYGLLAGDPIPGLDEYGAMT